MQYSVAAYYLVNAIWVASSPFLLGSTMSDYMNQALQRNAALNPDVPPPPPEVLSMLTSIMTFSLVIGAALGVIVAAVAIAGALKRWTWVFYVVLVLLGLSAAAFPFSVVNAFGNSTLTPLRLPFAVTAVSIVFGLAAIALFAWMLVAALRRGPWAMTYAAPTPAAPPAA